MITYGPYVAGWMESGVCDFYASLPHAFPSLRYSLITCLDSNLHPWNLFSSDHISPALKASAKKVGDAVLLPTHELLHQQMYRNIFVGFDEVWFFSEPVSARKPESTWIVGPARVSQPKLNSLGAWMSQHACAMGLGDGDGLNFIIKAHGLIRHLIAHTLNENSPESTIEFETFHPI